MNLISQNLTKSRLSQNLKIGPNWPNLALLAAKPVLQAFKPYSEVAVTLPREEYAFSGDLEALQAFLEFQELEIGQNWAHLALSDRFFLAPEAPIAPHTGFPVHTNVFPSSSEVSTEGISFCERTRGLTSFSRFSRLAKNWPNLAQFGPILGSVMP